MRTRRRLLILFGILLVAGVLVARLAARGPAVPEGSYVILELGGRYAEGPPQDLLGSLLHRRERTMLDLLTLIRTAQADGRVKGIIARITTLDIGWAKVQDLRDALRAFRASGKTVIAVLEQEVRGANREYYLATAADRVYLAPGTTAPLTGLLAQFVFFGGVWDKLGVQMTVEQTGEYKTLGDTIAKRSMTAAHREMADALLDSLLDQFVAGIAEGRRLPPGRVRALIDECPVSPAEFVAAGLADGARYVDEVRRELAADGEVPLVPMDDYARVPPRAVGLDRGPRLAVVFGAGTVTMGESGTGITGSVLGARTVAKALADAAGDADIRAILFRIDSPGGSALASDLIWRATQEARRKKPVVVSMSDVAASGGYYIAAGASRIVAQPATMTGSIGVVLARPNVAGLLERLGISTATLARGRFADLDSVITPLGPGARARLVEELHMVYDTFVDRVAEGRNLPRERVLEVARGRVWTGTQARDAGLVDELGGLQAALAVTKAAAGIDPSEEVTLVFYPRRKGLVERLGEALDAGTSARLPRALREVLASLGPPLPDNAPLAVMPVGIDIR